MKLRMELVEIGLKRNGKAGAFSVRAAKCA